MASMRCCVGLNIDVITTMFDGIMPADVLKSGRGPRMSDDDELLETESELGWFAEVAV